MLREKTLCSEEGRQTEQAGPCPSEAVAPSTQFDSEGHTAFDRRDHPQLHGERSREADGWPFEIQGGQS
jgi:hypothetical protein